MEYKVEDIVLVYKDTPTFQEGAICQVIDRDPNDNSYAVADLRDIGKADFDIQKILTRHVKWVDVENMQKLEFTKEVKKSYMKGIVTSIILCLFMLLMVLFL